MSEKSSTSGYIGAPEEVAEWIECSVTELLNGAAETSTDSLADDESNDSSNGSNGLLSRLLGV